MLAAASKGHAECVAVLVAAGARHLTANKTGDTPLSLAVAAGSLEMTRALVALAGASALMKRPNAKGVHPLGMAAVSGHVEVLECLLSAGGSAEERDANGATLLALAAFGGQPAVLRALLARDGIHVDATDDAGATPLWCAASAGHAECVELLLDAGADASATSGGRSALEAATANRHKACCELLSAAVQREGA